MKEYNDFCYEAIALNGHHGLSIPQCKTVDSAVESINDNVRQANQRGYFEDEKWLIVRTEWGSKYNGNRFVSSWRKREAVAMYDNGKVTDINDTI